MTNTIIVRQPTITHTARGSRASARLEGPGFAHELWYEVTGCPVEVDATPFVVAALPMAMARGWHLDSEAPASSRLLQSIPNIQNILRFWIPNARRIAWTIPSEVAQKYEDKSGAFFSGGVDSYYTFLKHRDTISAHIFVTGFDIPLSNPALAARVSSEMRRTSASFGVNLVEVKTNLREFCDQFVNWRYYHGAALASVAHLLSRQLGTIYIGATHTYADLFPCGSHPMLDPLWSSEAVELIHDGCEATRFQKVEALAQSLTALKTLRVCYRNKSSELNCGRCEKCLRTMTSLYALNVLQHCESFATKLDTRRIAQLRLGDNPRILMYVQENIDALKERKDDPHVAGALKQSMRRPGLLRQLQRQAKPLVRRSTYMKLLRGGKPPQSI